MHPAVYVLLAIASLLLPTWAAVVIASSPVLGDGDRGGLIFVLMLGMWIMGHVHCYLSGLVDWTKTDIKSAG